MVQSDMPPTVQVFTSARIVQLLKQQETALDTSAVAEQVMAWTNGQPELTQALLDRVMEAASRESELEPKEIVNNQVKAYFSSDLLVPPTNSTSPLIDSLTTIKDVLLQDQHQDCRLLQYYRAVLLSPHRLPQGFHAEQETLLDIGLLRENKVGQVKVANPLYRRIFSPDWVEQQLSQPFVLQKGQWLLLTSLLSILAFILLQSIFRYIPFSAGYRCNQASDLRDAVLAKLSLDPAQMQQSMEELQMLKKQDQLTMQCESVLHDLQYSYGIYVAAGTHNNPIEAATYLCQIPETYYVERNSVPWFSRWANLYRSNDFAASLAAYVEDNPCPGYTFLKRTS